MWVVELDWKVIEGNFYEIWGIKIIVFLRVEFEMDDISVFEDIGVIFLGVKGICGVFMLSFKIGFF